MKTTISGRREMKIRNLFIASIWINSSIFLFVNATKTTPAPVFVALGMPF
jgi:hypothetical protein